MNGALGSAPGPVRTAHGPGAGRAEITAEILDAARGYLATDGAPALSLRAIARDLGMASSALYRYFKSRDELLTRLIIDAYDSLGAAAEVREATIDRNDLAGRFTAICEAVRAWALAHPNEYALIYGSPVPGYVAPADTVQPATRVTALLLRIIVDAATAGRAPAEDAKPSGGDRPGPDPLPPASRGPRPARPARPHGVDEPVRRRLVRALRPAARGRGGGPRRPRRLLRRVRPPLDPVHRHLTPPHPPRRFPAASASSDCRGSPEASTAEPGSASPSVSAMIAMVEAVPIVLHAPSPWPRQLSSLAQDASSSAPLRRESYSRHKAVRCPAANRRTAQAPGTRR